MRKQPKSKPRPRRAGRAGLFATFAIAFAGVLIGAFAAYVSERGAAARAARTSALNADLRTGYTARQRAREAIVERVMKGGAQLKLPEAASATGMARPKIILIFDDMGIDRAAFEQAVTLPGPLTFSFLPYAENINAMAKTARARGDEIMLHLPMQPEGDADPGPNALKLGMTGGQFIRSLEWNLARLEGYAGVNNHMGSKLTADEAAMKTVLAYLKERDLFFLDSVTTGESVARAAGSMVGARVFSRDVFIDAVDDPIMIRRQLALTERIALETGYVVAICHPRQSTLDIVGPWLTTAAARGFDLKTVSELIEIEKETLSPLIAEKPALRL